MSYKILVVDDTKFMRKMLTDMLMQYGYNVVGEADNGKQAVQRYAELRPDVVMMDITMPEMDGIEAMREIRRIDPHAVVLICSAMSQQDLISDALKAGANGYVMKPFKPNRVHEIIRKYAVPRIPVVETAPAKPLSGNVEPAEKTPEIAAPAANVVAFPTHEREPEALSPVQGEETLPSAVAAAAEDEPEANDEAATNAESEAEEAAAEAVEALAETDAADETMEELHAVTLERKQEEVEEEPEEALLPIAETEAAEAQEASGEPVRNEEELTLDDLNDLTLMVDGLLPLSQESGIEPSIEPVAEAVQEPDALPKNVKESVSEISSKVITLNRGNSTVKNFTSSYMCNWTEECNGQSSRYLVICTESENRISIEMTTGDAQSTVEVSLEGFKQLMSWLEDKLAMGSNVRELAKKAEP